MGASESIPSPLYAETLALPAQALEPRSRRLLRRGIVALEAAADFVSSACAILAADWIDVALRGAGLPFPSRELELLSISAALLAVLLFDRDGAYRGAASLLHIRETERCLRIPVQLLLILLPFSRLFDPTLPLRVFLLTLLLMPVFLMLQKQVFLGAVRILRRSDQGADRVVLYGAGDTARRVVSALLHALSLGLRPVAIIDEDATSERNSVFELGYRRARSVPAYSDPISPSLLKSCRCQLLIVATHNLSAERVAAAEHAARQAGVRIAFLSGSEFHAHWGSESVDLDGLSILSAAPPSESWLYWLAKRGLDIVVSSLLLTAIAPLLFLLGLLVRFDSPGPAVFVQRRVGRNGELFSMYKLRSMYIDAPRYQCSPVTSGDARITRIGRLLRRLSLDELPQLLNVFKGDMSLVGPRPEMPFIVQSYSAEHRQRLQVTPGITGLWQLSADRALPIHEALQYDLYYIRHRGLFMDIAILMHTLFFAIGAGI